MTAKNEGVKDLRPGWVRELLRSPFLPLSTLVRGRAILRSSLRRGSTNFGFIGFSEVRLKRRSANLGFRGFSDSSRAPGSVGRCARLVLRGEEKFTHPRDTPARALRLSLPQGRDVPDQGEKGAGG